MAFVPGIPTITNSATSFRPRLINGDEIAVAYENLEAAAGEAIGYLAPVALDGSGLVVPATAGTPAIGVAMFEVIAGATARTVSVLRAGVLNPDAIEWDASYDTAAEKAAAFRGAPAPTNIIVKASL